MRTLKLRPRPGNVTRSGRGRARRVDCERERDTDYATTRARSVKVVIGSLRPYAAWHGFKKNKRNGGRRCVVLLRPPVRLLATVGKTLGLARILDATARCTCAACVCTRTARARLWRGRRVVAKLNLRARRAFDDDIVLLLSRLLLSLIFARARASAVTFRGGIARRRVRGPRPKGGRTRCSGARRKSENPAYAADLVFQNPK